jgi:hypothetical protein
MNFGQDANWAKERHTMYFRKMKLLQILLVIFISLPVSIFAAEYRVSNSTSDVDGATFCGGNACTSSDVIIIEGGTRGSLRLRNFNGNGSYITITNENKNPNSRVVIENTGGVGTGVLSIKNCKYIDLRGNNDPDLLYGIKIFHDTDPRDRSGSIKTEGDCDFIKISYTEIEHYGTDVSLGSSCIQVQSNELGKSVTLSDYEIHHNYLQDCRYAGMYLGNNEPDRYDSPYISNFYVHHNVFEDMGAYGLTLKGINGGTNSISHNKVNRTGKIPRKLDDGRILSDEYFHGLGSQYLYNGATVSIHNNRVEHAVGPGLKIAGADIQIHDNLILGCGSGKDAEFGHGILLHAPWTESVDIYENILVQAGLYGVFSRWGAKNNVLVRNIIVGSGNGEYEGINNDGGGFIEGTGEDQNIYKEEVSDVNFPVWSDDGNYANDVFKDLMPPLLKVVGS